MARLWWEWMIPMTGQAALVVAVVFLLAITAHRASPRLRCALWWVVLVKLCLPPTLSSPVGLGRMVREPSPVVRTLLVPAPTPERTIDPAPRTHPEMRDARGGSRAPRREVSPNQAVGLIVWSAGVLGSVRPLAATPRLLPGGARPCRPAA